MRRGIIRIVTNAKRPVGPTLGAFFFVVVTTFGAGCWSQGGTGYASRDGGPPLAAMLDASTHVPTNPNDAGQPVSPPLGDAGHDAGDDPSPPHDGGANAPTIDAGATKPDDDAGSNDGRADAGGADAGGPPTGTVTFACGDIVGCASHCNNDAACRTRCRSYGDPPEQARYDTVYACITQNGCTDVTCSFARCSNEITACRANGKSCSLVLQCADTCTDDACEQACIATGTPFARQLIDMIVACGQTHGCSNATCLLTSCRAQVQACLDI